MPGVRLRVDVVARLVLDHMQIRGVAQGRLHLEGITPDEGVLVLRLGEGALVYAVDGGGAHLALRFRGLLRLGDGVVSEDHLGEGGATRVEAGAGRRSSETIGWMWTRGTAVELVEVELEEVVS